MLEIDLPKRALQCMECDVPFRKKPQGASFLKIHLRSMKRVDLCEECAKKKNDESPNALWQWSRKEEKRGARGAKDQLFFQELIDLLFTEESTLGDQEKFILAHVLKRGRMIRQRGPSKEALVVETLDRSKMVSVPIPEEALSEEAFHAVHALFQQSGGEE